VKKTLCLALLAAATGAGITLAIAPPGTPEPVVPTFIQDDEAAAADARHMAKVRKALELSGSAKQGKAVMDQMLAQFASIPGLPPGFLEKFSEMVKPSDLTELTVPIWKKHLTEQDLNGLIAFYTSPAGKSFLEAQPAIQQESMVVGQKWGQEMAMKVLQELDRDGN